MTTYWALRRPRLCSPPAQPPPKIRANVDSTCSETSGPRMWSATPNSSSSIVYDVDWMSCDTPRCLSEFWTGDAIIELIHTSSCSTPPAPAMIHCRRNQRTMAATDGMIGALGPGALRTANIATRLLRLWAASISTPLGTQDHLHGARRQDALPHRGLLWQAGGGLVGSAAPRARHLLRGRFLSPPLRPWANADNRDRRQGHQSGPLLSRRMPGTTR